MKKLTAVIIDDERLARVSLSRELARFDAIDIIGEASNIQTASKVIEKLTPDILFLDIQLSDGSGFDLLDRIEYKGKIVFVTAFDEYATRAFEVNALDYLMKPVSHERVETVVKRLTEGSPITDNKKTGGFRYDDRIMIEQKKSIHFIKLDTLVCIKAERDYTMLTDSTGKEYLVFENIGEWQKKLPDEHFARIHRNLIINFNFIEKAEKYGYTAKIFLKNIRTPVTVSRGYYKLIKARYFYK